MSSHGSEMINRSPLIGLGIGGLSRVWPEFNTSLRPALVETSLFHQVAGWPNPAQMLYSGL
jgi:hypothetical protein